MNAVLVAVVASYGLSAMAHGLLRRCGFLVIEHRCLADARRLIEHGPAPAFVVVMPDSRRHHQATPDNEGSLSAFLDGVRGLLASDHVIATSAHGLRPDDLQRCLAAGMRVLTGDHVSIRRLARFLMQLQGSDGTRCCVSATEHATPPSRRTPPK
jgi:hypothetical protein